MASQEQILFGGLPEIPSPEAFAEIRAQFSPERKERDEAIESFRKSPANKGLIPESGETGATLEQVYNFLKLLGAEKYCLLSSNQAEVPTGRIQRVIRMTSNQLVQSLKQIDEIDGDVLATLLHFDGHTGHCVILDYYDKDLKRFFYRDPWPWDSLLCKKNNMADVDARKEISNFWSVTDKELESVIFAVYVYPGQWDRMQKNLHVLRSDDFKTKDLFKFFHLIEIDRVKYDNANQTEVQYSPSNFKGIVVISLLVSSSDRIKSAILLMKKDWMKQNFFLVPDITRSFLRTFAPDKDLKPYEDICSSLNLNVLTKIASNLGQEKGNDRDYKNDFLLSFMGLGNDAFITFDYSILQTSNALQQNIPSFKITITLP